MILHYLTVLFKVFDLPKALILGFIFDSVLGSVFGPLPGRSANRTGAVAVSLLGYPGAAFGPGGGRI